MGWLKGLYQRYLFTRHLPPHWRYRPRTLDARILRSVVIENEYRLPPRFQAEDVIVDIGAHIGSFALAVLNRGAGQVHCFEPHPDNFALLCENLSPFEERVNLYSRAVWRSDESFAGLAVENPIAARNTGAYRLTAATSPASVEVTSLDDILTSLEPKRRVRLLKLDCEGAEWPILFTAKHLDRVDAICGEYHLGPLPAMYSVDELPYNEERLKFHLRSLGFQVQLRELPPVPHRCGLFFAGRAGRMTASSGSSSESSL